MEAPHIPLLAAADGVILTVRLNPRARRDAIEGVSEEAGPRGTMKVLRAAVTAPPEDGKANAALLALLAKRCRLPKSAFSIVGGAAHRVKRVHVRGEPAALAARLAERLGAKRR
ncbi:MAG TPA: DUF167 family protein [Alphaproteobacteria bacterium]|nr:DUF167 family protein [Alphaproteobacteria bacterium]